MLQVSVLDWSLLTLSQEKACDKPQTFVPSRIEIVQHMATAISPNSNGIYFSFNDDSPSHRSDKASAFVKDNKPVCQMLLDLIPVLSAQLMTAPTGRPSEIRNLAPDDPPRPEQKNKNITI